MQPFSIAFVCVATYKIELNQQGNRRPDYLYNGPDVETGAMVLLHFFLP